MSGQGKNARAEATAPAKASAKDRIAAVSEVGLPAVALPLLLAALGDIEKVTELPVAAKRLRQANPVAWSAIASQDPIRLAIAFDRVDFRKRTESEPSIGDVAEKLRATAEAIRAELAPPKPKASADSAAA